MEIDNRFEFLKFESPSTWLNLTNGAGGAFRSGGKMKLPPGHALANKFPDKVATKEEMAARDAKMGGAGGGDGDLSDVVKDAEKIGLGKEASAMSKLNNNMSPDDVVKNLSEMQRIDEITTDVYNYYTAKGQAPPLWNQTTRDLFTAAEIATSGLESLKRMKTKEEVMEFGKDLIDDNFQLKRAIGVASGASKVFKGLSAEERKAIQGGTFSSTLIKDKSPKVFDDAAKVLDSFPKMVDAHRAYFQAQIDRIAASKPSAASTKPRKASTKPSTRSSKEEDLEDLTDLFI